MINLTTTGRARLLRKQARQLKALERAATPKLRTYFAQLGRLAGKSYAATLDKGAALNAVGAMRPKLRQALQATWRRSALTFGSDFFDSFLAVTGSERAGYGPDQLRVIPKQYDPEFMAALADFSMGFGAEQIADDIDDYSRVLINGVVSSNVEAGLGAFQVGRNIEGLFDGDIGRVRANRIARTETHNAMTYGLQSAAHSTGFDMQKTWVTALDERVRDTNKANHRAADGQSVPLNQDFIVSGRRMSRPGDQRGGAANVINCRCTMSFELL